MNNFIHSYVYGDGRQCNQKVGVLVGVKHGEEVFISGSKANINAGDKFDRKVGVELAVDRMICLLQDGRTSKIAASLEPALERFVARCVRYFKTTAIHTPAVVPYRKAKVSKPVMPADNVDFEA